MLFQSLLSIEASLEVLNHQVCSYVHWHVRHEINHSPKDVECIEDINEQKIMMQVRKTEQTGETFFILVSKTSLSP